MLIYPLNQGKSPLCQPSVILRQVQFLFLARPADRGLEVYETENEARVWYFPPDYPERITPVIERLQAADAENGQGGGRSKSAR